MKQGSADDPFADESTDDSATESRGESAPEDRTDEVTATDPVGSELETTTQQPTARSLPYIHSRDGVKDGRTQRPVFLRDHIEDGIADLVAQMEAEFGEDVYKTDVTEAAMAIAEENPELVAAKLDEWGYGWS